VFELYFGQVLEHVEPVVRELANEAAYVKVGIDAIRQREVIGLG